MDMPAGRKKNLGLIGLYRCGNLGDEAIWQAFAGTLPALLGPDWSLRLIAFGPGGFETAAIPANENITIEILHRLALDDSGSRGINWSFWLGSGGMHFAAALADCDAVWYAGGHWIHDLSTTTLAGVMAPLMLARLRGANAGFVNVGAGPLKGIVGRALTRFALGGPGPLVLRDEHSAQVLRDSGTGRRPVVGADAAFLLESADADVVSDYERRYLPDDGRERIGLVPCAWFKMADLYSPSEKRVAGMVRFLAQWINEQAGKGRAVTLIPTMLPEDRQVCLRIAQSAGLDQACVLATERIPAPVLMGLVGRLRALVSFRMHPVLFAYKTGTPFLAMNYAPKQQSLVELLGMDRWLVSLEGAWEAEFSRRFDELIQDDDPFSGATIVDHLADRAVRGIRAALETLS